MPSPSSGPPDILLDACVIQSFIDKFRGPQYSLYIAEIIARGHTLAISEITTYELLQGVPVNKEQHLLSILQQIKHYLVDQNVLIAAAQMRTLCNMEKIERDQISDGDRILAATSILTGSFILTENFNDFPL